VAVIGLICGMALFLAFSTSGTKPSAAPAPTPAAPTTAANPSPSPQSDKSNSLDLIPNVSGGLGAIGQTRADGKPVWFVESEQSHVVGEWVEAENVTIHLFNYDDKKKNDPGEEYILHAETGHYNPNGNTGSLTGNVHFTGPQTDVITPEVTWERGDNDEVKLTSTKDSVLTYGTIKNTCSGFEILLKQKRFRLESPNKGLLVFKKGTA